MKAIILAAGRGSRLGTYTEEKPKCMLEIGNMTILERLIKTFRDAGFDEIVVVKGYKSESINYRGIKYYLDNEHKYNMVYSLFCAEPELHGDLVISYADILLEERVLQAVLDSPTANDISLVVDTDWEGYHRERFGDPFLGAESLILDSDGKIIEIGERQIAPKDVQGVHIGLIKLSSAGTRIFKEAYNEAKMKFWNKPWRRGKEFQKSDISDFLQGLIEANIPIWSIPIQRGWLEIDSVEDYENTLEWLRQGTLSRFCSIEINSNDHKVEAGVSAGPLKRV